MPSMPGLGCGCGSCRTSCTCRRLEYKPHLIRWEEVEPESVTGKQYVHAFDKAGRPIVFMRPRCAHGCCFIKSCAWTRSHSPCT